MSKQNLANWRDILMVNHTPTIQVHKSDSSIISPETSKVSSMNVIPPKKENPVFLTPKTQPLLDSGKFGSIEDIPGFFT